VAEKKSLTPEQIDSLIAMLEDARTEEAVVDRNPEEEAMEIDAYIASLVETHDKLLTVIAAYLPKNESATVVQDSLKVWMTYALRCMIGEQRVLRDQIVPYDDEEMQALLDDPDTIRGRVDYDALLERRAIVPEPAVPERTSVLNDWGSFPTTTQALAVAVAVLLVLLIIVSQR
jgi:hypothetical protein